MPPTSLCREYWELPSRAAALPSIATRSRRTLARLAAAWEIRLKAEPSKRPSVAAKDTSSKPTPTTRPLAAAFRTSSRPMPRSRPSVVVQPTRSAPTLHFRRLAAAWATSFLPTPMARPSAAASRTPFKPTLNTPRSLVGDWRWPPTMGRWLMPAVVSSTMATRKPPFMSCTT